MQMIFKQGQVEIWAVTESYGTEYYVYGVTASGDPRICPSIGLRGCSVMNTNRETQTVTLQQVYDALDHLPKNHRVQEVGPANLSPTKLNYLVDGLEITAAELVAMAAR